MRSKTLVALFSSLALLIALSTARAGAIRKTGKMIGHGSTKVAGAAATGGEAVAGGAAEVGKGTGHAAKTAGTATVKGAEATPGVVTRGTKAGAKAVWKVIW